MTNKIIFVLVLLFIQGRAMARVVANRGLNLATYNVRNYGSGGAAEKSALLSTNHRVLRKLINETKADLLVVEEIIDADGFKKFINSTFKQYKVFINTCGGRGHQKLGFVYNSSKLTLKKVESDFRVKEKKGCDEGVRPVVIGHFKERSSNFSFITMAIHLRAGGDPSKIAQRHQQIKVLSRIIKDYKKKNQNIALLGDFNTTEYIGRGRYYNKFVNFVDDNDLVDFSASLNCSAYWWGGIDDDLFYPSLLDHVLVSSSFWNRYRRQEVEVLAHCQKFSCQKESEEDLGVSFKEVSDHCPVVATFK